MTTVNCTSYHVYKYTMDNAATLLKEELARCGLTNLFTLSVHPDPLADNVIISLVHRMHLPGLKESFTDLVSAIEDEIVDSALFEEHMAASNSELVKAQEQLVELKKQVSELQKYKTWYELEQKLLEATVCIESTKRASSESVVQEETSTNPSPTPSPWEGLYR